MLLALLLLLLLLRPLSLLSPLWPVLLLLRRTCGLGIALPLS
jgi:hypothetical protein